MTAAFRQVLGIIVFLQCTRMFVGDDGKKTTKLTLSFHDYLKAKRQKKMNFEYYPNYGYEPYWADGEWILSTTLGVTEHEDETTTKLPKVCGEPCSYLLRRIKKVCGRKSDNTEYDPNGCANIRDRAWKTAWDCPGKPGDDYQQGYVTFDTYCAFLDAQCHSKFYDKSRWVFLHVGPCLNLSYYFKPLWSGDQPVSRAEYFLEVLANSSN